MKATATAPANVGLIKYWGRKDEELRLPCNGSISMNLSNLTTTTTVEFDTDLNEDVLTINNEEHDVTRVSEHLDRIRSLAGIQERARVTSENSFPSGTGLSSSASGYAALTLAATNAAGLQLSERELSILARQGSGSACRSIPDGFVEWLDGETSAESYAQSIFPADHWDIVDIVAVVSTEKKHVSSSDGQKDVRTSPFYETRLLGIPEKLRLCKEVIAERNFTAFGELIEAEALSMHAVMLTQFPPLIYWHPATVTLMRQVQQWRTHELPCYFTVNTGQDVHILCERENADTLVENLQSIGAVRDVIVNTASSGARLEA